MSLKEYWCVLCPNFGRVSRKRHPEYKRHLRYYEKSNNAVGGNVLRSDIIVTHCPSSLPTWSCRICTDELSRHKGRYFIRQVRCVFVYPVMIQSSTLYTLGWASTYSTTCCAKFFHQRHVSAYSFSIAGVLFSHLLSCVLAHYFASEVFFM